MLDTRGQTLGQYPGVDMGYYACSILCKKPRLAILRSAIRHKLSMAFPIQYRFGLPGVDNEILADLLDGGRVQPAMLENILLHGSVFIAYHDQRRQHVLFSAIGRPLSVHEIPPAAALKAESTEKRTRGWNQPNRLALAPCSCCRKQQSRMLTLSRPSAGRPAGLP